MELRGHSGRRPWRLPRRVITIRRPVRPRAGRSLVRSRTRGLLVRAELELARVRRRELGLLFLAAALLAQRKAGLAVLVEPLFFEVERLSEWRENAAFELETRSEAERAQPIVKLLTTMLERPLEDWTSPSLLAALGARLAPGRAARLAEAQVLSQAGRHQAAESRLRALAQNDLTQQEAWRVLTLLGRCHLSAGRTLFALGAFEAACESPDCGVGALVESLALARVLGDESRVRRAAARLDLLIEESDPEFRAAIADLRARVEEGRFPRTSRGGRLRGAESPAERVLALVGS